MTDFTVLFLRGAALTPAFLLHPAFICLPDNTILHSLLCDIFIED